MPVRKAREAPGWTWWDVGCSMELPISARGSIGVTRGDRQQVDRWALFLNGILRTDSPGLLRSSRRSGLVRITMESSVKLGCGLARSRQSKECYKFRISSSEVRGRSRVSRSVMTSPGHEPFGQGLHETLGRIQKRSIDPLSTQEPWNRLGP